MPFAPTYDVPAERRAYVELARVENGNGRIGLLMLHGYMGSPLSSHPMANYLAGHGVSVHCPLLPGHGHYPDKLHKVPGRRGSTRRKKHLPRCKNSTTSFF
jgi:carboxylesterase